jgi:hypothetical protein
MLRRLFVWEIGALSSAGKPKRRRFTRLFSSGIAAFGRHWDGSKRLITPKGSASLELTSRTQEPLSVAGPVQGRKGVKL